MQHAFGSAESHKKLKNAKAQRRVFKQLYTAEWPVTTLVSRHATPSREIITMQANESLQAKQFQ